MEVPSSKAGGSVKNFGASLIIPSDAPDYPDIEAAMPADGLDVRTVG
ncbi:hypothetical protein [Mesorhizobium sanjuanii]|nr:hypothetical protein [Mesorhizobium sanjuanii]